MCVVVNIRRMVIVKMVEEEDVVVDHRHLEDAVVDLRPREDVVVVDLRHHEDDHVEGVVQDHHQEEREEREERKTFPKLVRRVVFIFLRSNSNVFKRKSRTRVRWRINE